MYLFDQNDAKSSLQSFFSNNGSAINNFGKTVNQTFEAYVFASTIKWYSRNKWDIKCHNPKYGPHKGQFQLKFSTRGAPKNYTFIRCTKGNQTVQIRHGLRVATKFMQAGQKYPSNLCLDVSIINDNDLSYYGTSDSLPNDQLVTFGEAKHMSGFAELIAGFIGMVHEMKPDFLKKKKLGKHHPQPFLYVSGRLNPTAKGIKETIEYRKIQVDIYSFDNKMT